MQEFSRKHEARIQGVLFCFDRMLFRGYLPIMSGWSMEQFLNGLEMNSGSLKPFLLENAERVKGHAIGVMADGLRPIGKPLDLPPYPKMPRALHFYPDQMLQSTATGAGARLALFAHRTPCRCCRELTAQPRTSVADDVG